MERKINKLDSTKVKPNDLMALIYYVKVKNVFNNGNELHVMDLDNDHKEIQVKGKELVESSFSADQYLEEQKVSRTEAAELLINSPNRPFTVSFSKADGTERILKGRLIKPEPLLGRSMVEDLETNDKNRIRQVDHRTLNFLIVDAVKYIVK